MNVLIIAVKEILDNLRDRQTVFYALLFGPVLLPLLLGGSLVASFKQLAIDYDVVERIGVVHAKRAPGLLAFLAANNIEHERIGQQATGSGFRDELLDGDRLVVLEIGEDYAESLRAGTPAPLTIHYNESDRQSDKAARRLGNELQRYKQTLDALRLQHRGIDPSVFNSLDIQRNDVSAEGSRGQMLASLLPFLFIMSMVMGGFYLAVDTTAGERERSSLEPLLALPLSRRDVVLGKYLAVLVFVTLSGFLTAVCVYGLFRLFPDALALTELRFDGPVVTRSFLLALPLAPLLSALLVSVAAYTRSTKEAQTYLALLMIIPMTPYFLLQFMTIKSVTATMWVPMLSQYQLLEKVALSEALPAMHVWLSIGGTLLLAGLLLRLALHLYSRERILY